MSKDDAINIMNNSSQMDKITVLSFFYFFFLLQKKKKKKQNGTTYYHRNEDVILNRVKDYFENNKERLREQVNHKYKSLSEEEKTKKENMEKRDIIVCPRKTNEN